MVSTTILSTDKGQTLILISRWHLCSDSRDFNKNTWMRSSNWKAVIGSVECYAQVVAIPPLSFDVMIALGASSSANHV